MCECGCGNTAPDFKFTGPNGIMYAIQLHGGCDNCDTPAGVILYRFVDDRGQGNLFGDTPDSAWFEDAPDLPFVDHKGNVGTDADRTAECYLGLIHPGKLAELLAKALEANIADSLKHVDDFDDTEELLEGVKEGADEDFSEAFSDALKDAHDKFVRPRIEKARQLSDGKGGGL